MADLCTGRILAKNREFAEVFCQYCQIRLQKVLLQKVFTFNTLSEDELIKFESLLK